MKDMKMKTKMIIGFIIPILFTLINVIFGMMSVSSIDKIVRDMQNEQVEVVEAKMEEIGADQAKAAILAETLESTATDDIENIDSRAMTSNIISFG